MDEILKTLVPGIASFVLGPVGGILAKAGVDFLADKMGVKADTKEDLKNILSGMSGDQLVKMKELDIQFQEFCKENDIKLQLEQIKLNEIEAEAGKNTTGWQAFFIAGWRPALGWVGVSGLAYHFIFMPLVNGVLAIAAVKGKMPPLDIADLMALTLNLLGFAAMRSYDKKNGNGGGH